MRRLLILATLTLCAAVSMSVSAQPAQTYVVLFSQENLSPGQTTAVVEAAGGEIVRNHANIGVAIARSDDPGFAKALQRNPAVQEAALDVTIQGPELDVHAIVDTQPLESLTASIENSAANASTATLDPTQADFFEFQWNMRDIHAPEAWALGHLGDPNVSVAVVDTGIDYRHPELAGKVDLSRSVSFVPEEDLVVQAEFPGAHPVADLHLHGTHAAGVIACNLFGTACLAPNVTLVGVKVLDRTLSGSIGNIVSGVEHSIDADVDIIHLGLFKLVQRNDKESRPARLALRRAIQRAEKEGILVLADAGFGAPDPLAVFDADRDGNQVILPAQSSPLAITVSATAPGDVFSDISNWGHSLVDLTAPGGRAPQDASEALTVTILSPCTSFSLNPLAAICRDNDFHVTVAGSISAVPHVTGVAALIDSMAGGAMDAKQLRQQLFNTLDDIGQPGKDAFFGHGKINALRAVTE